MNIISRILSVCLSLSFLLLIIELIRRHRLKEKYAILWIVTGITIFSLAVFEKLLALITKLFGISYPINALFFFGIFFIILINLHFSMIVSNLSEQNKKIVQKLGLLETKIKSMGQSE